MDALGEVGQVNVITTERRGMTPEEWAGLCRQRIIDVAETAPQPLRDQARAYQREIEKVVAIYMKKAINSDRTTIYNALLDAGHPELAALVRRL